MPAALARLSAADGGQRRCPRQRRVLEWAFTILNALRALTCLPCIAAIVASGHSGGYSLLTWAIWVGANASTALWVYENNGGRLDKVVALNLANAGMCTATLAVIVAYR